MFDQIPNPLDPDKFDVVLKNFEIKKRYDLDPVRFKDRYMSYH